MHQGVFFFFNYSLANSMTNIEPKFSQVFIIHVEIHQVRRLVFDNLVSTVKDQSSHLVYLNICIK